MVLCSPPYQSVPVCTHPYTCRTPPAQFSDEELLHAFKVNLAAERMITLNILIDQSGVINPDALAQFKRVKAQLS